MPSTSQWASMPQKFLKFLKHAAHCGRRPRVSFDKQFRVGINAFLVFKNFQQRTGHRRPYSFLFFNVIDPQGHSLLYSVVPTPAQRAFYFLQNFNVQRLFSLIFLLSQFFTNFQGSSALFTFSKFGNLSLHDQILNQI